MADEVIAHRPREISGFTLFWSDSKYDNGKDPPKVPGWQMNVRRKGEAGWDCKQITEEQAQAILSMLETSGHPDGPWSVRQRETWASLDGPARAIQIHAEKGYGDWEEVQRALEADGEKLRQLTGEDHGPWRIDEQTCRHGKPLHQDCFACDEEDGREGIPVALKPTYDAPEDIADFLSLVLDWKSAIVENTEARNGVA